MDERAYNEAINEQSLEGNEMNYAIAKQVKAQLESEERQAAEALKAFPKGPMGLTPDSVKATPEWKAAYLAHAAAFQALRKFNGSYFKAFKKEIAAERKVR